MKHLIKTVPEHALHADGSVIKGEVPAAQDRKTYIHRTEIPHFLNKDHRLGQVPQGIVSMIVPFDLPIEPQDTIADEYGFQALVVAIQERRPARGIWKEPRPHFVKIQYL